ncbi:MAG: hypothetical protein ACLUNH_10500 [Hominenteromicrobium sp.]|nr:hypothetical protein [Bacillota bacterium]MDY4107462.1 hypothetical protein [Oscillospiraceae bacterium]
MTITYEYGPEAFDAMPAEDIEACRKLCENAGAKFRVREYISE